MHLFKLDRVPESSCVSLELSSSAPEKSRGQPLSANFCSLACLLPALPAVLGQQKWREMKGFWGRGHRQEGGWR